MQSEAGPWLWVQLVLLLGGLLWALVCVGFMVAKWRVPAVISTAPLGAHALAVIVGAGLAERGMGVAAGADPAARATLVAAGISGILSNATLGVAAVPTAGLLVIGGTIAGFRGPRRWGSPFLAFVVAGTASLMALVGVAYEAALGLSIGRFLMYALAVIPVALAMAGRHPASNSREGAVAAGVGFAALVASVELAASTHGWTLGFSALASVGPTSRAEITAALVAEMAPLQTLGWAAFGLATVVAFLGLFRGESELTEEEILSGAGNPSPWRWFGNALALGVPMLWAAALLSTDVSEYIAKLGGA